jgi:hypothetical protein
MDLFLSNRWLPLLATLGAGALALYVGMVNLNEIRLIQTETSRTPISSNAAPSATQGQTHQTNLADIANWHLFGEAKKETTPVKPKPVVQHTEAPKTRLKLTLQGIFSPTVEGQTGWAIIEAPGENPKAYRIGDEVPGGATLTAVELSQVILTRNNRPESLPLEMKELSSDSYEIDEFEEMEPAPEVPQRPRTRARARAIPTPTATAENPGMEPETDSYIEPEMDSYMEPEMDSFTEPEMEPEMGYEEEPEPKEVVPHSPAVRAAEQDLIEEMKRLRESFKNSQ